MLVLYVQELNWAVGILNSISKHQTHQRESRSNSYDGSQRPSQPSVNILEILRHGLEPYLIAYWGMTMTLLEVRFF